MQRCYLTDVWKIIFAVPTRTGTTRTLVLFFLSKLCLEPRCAKNGAVCQDVEQLQREFWGLDGSYIQYVREVITLGFFFFIKS